MNRLFSREEPNQNESPFQGRGRLRTLDLARGETALVRTYRRGGFIRHFTKDLFFTWPPRPIRELVVTEAARRKDIATPELLGIGVQRVWGPFYRGWLVSRYLVGAEDLWEALHRKRFSESEKDMLLRSVASSIRWMHGQGFEHADLHLKNILVRREREFIKSYVIDFDKAKCFSGALADARAKKNLRRLLRSVNKLDPERRYFTYDDWKRFMRFYANGADT